MSRLALLLTLLIAVPASGQIFKVRLKDKKLERKYKTYLTNIDGKAYILGEHKSGVEFNKNNITIVGKNFIEVWVMDAKSPEKLPYKINRDGEKEAVSKKSSVSVPRDHLAEKNAFTYHLRNQTIPGIASEYQLRKGAVDDLRGQLSGHKRGTQPWFIAQRRLIDHLERLKIWLEAMSFTNTAARLDKSVKKEQKLLKEDAIRDRAAMGMNSIKPIEVPDDLVRVASEVGRGQLAFKAFESQHIRLMFPKKMLDDQTAKHLLELGETIVEGFRREFADPYPPDEKGDNGVTDETPDHVFALFVWVPDEGDCYEKFWTNFMGGTWPGDAARRKQELAMSGKRSRGMRAVTYTHYSKVSTETDFEGNIAHGLGHDMMNIHFNRGGRGVKQDWLDEACAYYCSFEYLGRNSVTCKQFKVAEYDRDPGAEGEKTVQLGMREAFNQLALKRGAPLSDLMLKELYQMDDPDLAKSWSFFDYIARKLGKKGVLWLRACCFYGAKRDGLLDRLREDSELIFGLKPGEKDVYTWLDEQWKEFARSGQKKDGSARGRRK